MAVDGARADTLLIVNPKSGRGDHVAPVARRAAEAGYAIEFTRESGHGAGLAEAAVQAEIDTLVAVGGDGTLNEVIQGADAVDGLGEVTIAVVPAGTGNDFATNVGIGSIEEGFATLAEGKRRELDLGLADGRPFVNSCIAGLTAEASEDTDPEMKSRFGVLAYVITTLRQLSEFDGIHLSAVVDEDETVWEGTAAMVLVGNGRRFTMTGGEQADIEDGLLDVTLVEDASALELIGDGTRDLFGDSGERMTRFLASSLELSVQSDRPITFSLDGEMVSRESVRFECATGRLRMPVGASYIPHPDASNGRSPPAR